MWKRFKEMVGYVFRGGEFTYHSTTSRPMTPEQKQKLDKVFDHMDDTFKSMDEFFKRFH